MLQKFNNIWVILLSILLLYVIVRKIINLNKPFDENRFIQQYKNQLKLKKQLNINIIQKNIPKLTSYYVGLWESTRVAEIKINSNGVLSIALIK